MEFRKATQEDLDYVRRNPLEGGVKDYPFVRVPDKNCVAIVFEGHVIGMGGLAILWEGVGEVWLILTADFKNYCPNSLVILHAIRDRMNKVIADNNLWRAHATVRTDFLKAIKMIEFFGFENETPNGMRNYLPDKGDAYLYSKMYAKTRKVEAK